MKKSLMGSCHSATRQWRQWRLCTCSWAEKKCNALRKSQVRHHGLVLAENNLPTIKTKWRQHSCDSHTNLFAWLVKWIPNNTLKTWLLAKLVWTSHEKAYANMNLFQDKGKRSRPISMQNALKHTSSKGCLKAYNATSLKLVWAFSFWSEQLTFFSSDGLRNVPHLTHNNLVVLWACIPYKCSKKSN